MQEEVIREEKQNPCHPEDVETPADTLDTLRRERKEDVRERLGMLCLPKPKRTSETVHLTPPPEG